MDVRPVLYGDVIFLINFVMDYIILWAAARFSQLKTSMGRLLLSSGVGAFYSFVVLFPQEQFLSGIVFRFLLSLIMVWIAFGHLSLRKIVLGLGYFYLVAFAAGGAMLGGIYFFNGRTNLQQMDTGFLFFLTEINYFWLFVAAAVTIALGRWGAAFIRKNLLHNIFRLPIIIRFGKHRFPVEAMVDTGNQLKDPISRKPVIIVEYEVLKKVLPEKVCAVFEDHQEPDLEKLVSLLANSPLAARIHLIPFTSIGRSRGMLLGLRPDEVIVVTNERPIKLKGVIMGIYQKRLSAEGSYRALLHPEVLQSAF